MYDSIYRDLLTTVVSGRAQKHVPRIFVSMLAALEDVVIGTSTTFPGIVR